MREYQEVMTTIKEFTADDALVIVGTVIDDAMERPAARDDDRDRARAARRPSSAQQRAPNMTLVEQPQVVARTGTDGVGVTVDNIDYQNFDAPCRDPKRRSAGGRRAPAIDATEIPAFLRKQAD